MIALNEGVTPKTLRVGVVRGDGSWIEFDARLRIDTLERRIITATAVFSNTCSVIRPDAAGGESLDEEVLMSLWPEISANAAESINDARIVPADDSSRGRRLAEQMHLSERSALGALVLNCAGLLVDHGWLRILGGGGAGLPDVLAASGLDWRQRLVVAHDVLGGVFAVDGGGLGIGPGEMCYFAPDTLEWEAMGIGHGQFIDWALTSEDYPLFYEVFRWDGWEAEVETLAPDQGISCYPFLSTKADMADVSRSVVPMKELFALTGPAL